MSGVQMKLGEFLFWTAIAFVIGIMVALAFVAPRQAKARAQIDGQPAAVASSESNPTALTPTRQHDLEAAFHACSTLTARLEADTGSKWDE